MAAVPLIKKYLVEFEDPELEHEYRQEFLKKDIRDAVIYFAFITCILLYSLFKRFVIYDNPGSSSYIYLRISTVAFLVFSIIICLRLNNIKITDLLLFLVTIVCNITFF